MPDRLDPEEFQIWLEHPITRLVLQHYRGRAQEGFRSLQEQLSNSLLSGPQEWAAMQSQAAHLRGLFSGFLEVAHVSFEDVNTEDQE